MNASLSLEKNVVLSPQPLATSQGVAANSPSVRSREEVEEEARGVAFTAAATYASRPSVTSGGAAEHKPPHPRKAQPASSPAGRPHKDTASTHPDIHITTMSVEEEEEGPERLGAVEQESWSRWGYRKTYNGLIMVGASMYQAMQATWRHQSVDAKVIDFTNKVFIPPPLHRSEMEMQAPQAQRRDRHLGVRRGSAKMSNPLMPGVDHVEV